MMSAVRALEILRVTGKSHARTRRRAHGVCEAEVGGSASHRVGILRCTNHYSEPFGRVSANLEMIAGDPGVPSALGDVQKHERGAAVAHYRIPLAAAQLVPTRWSHSGPA